MVHILAIETTGKTCSVALSSNNVIQAEYSTYEGNRHDRFAAEFCRRILNDNEITAIDLAAIAISIGPGSFTGLRIGMAIAKGMTIDNQPKLVAVPTLAAMAHNTALHIAGLLDDYRIVAAIPSHANLLYCQEFNAQGEALSDIIFADYDAINAKYFQQNIVIASNQAIDLKCGLKMKKNSQISASMIAEYGYNLYKNNDFTNSEDIVPLYIQEFIPKPNQTK